MTPEEKVTAAREMAANYSDRALAALAIIEANRRHDELMAVLGTLNNALDVANDTQRA